MEAVPRSKAALFLESLQAHFIETFGIAPTPWTFDEEYARKIAESLVPSKRDDRPRAVTEMVEFFRQQHVEDERAVPSPHENPGTYGLLMRLASAIESIARPASGDVASQPRPQFGTLRTGRVNAMAVRVPDSDEFLVLFEDGLFGFANLMAKAVASTFPLVSNNSEGWEFSTDQNIWRARLADDPAPIARMGDAVTAYLIRGHPHAAQPYLLPPEHMALASPLRESMELFVMGHEWGHILSGDLTVDSVTSGPVGADAADVVRLNFQQEFRADGIGAALAIRAQIDAGYDLAMCFCGIDLFFSCIDLVERSVSLMVWGEVRPLNSDSHPPSLLRRRYLREALAESVGAEIAQSAVGLATICEGVVNYSFERIAPIILSLRADGARLAPGWGIKV